MTKTSKLIEVSDVVDSLHFDYDLYVVGEIANRRTRRAMSTEFDHYTVMNALIDELMTNGPHEDQAAERVVKTITAQGVDVVYANDMARDGLKQLISSIGTMLPDVTFAAIEKGEISLCNRADLFITYDLD